MCRDTCHKRLDWWYSPQHNEERCQSWNSFWHLQQEQQARQLMWTSPANDKQKKNETDDHNRLHFLNSSALSGENYITKIGDQLAIRNERRAHNTEPEFHRGSRLIYCYTNSQPHIFDVTHHSRAQLGTSANTSWWRKIQCHNIRLVKTRFFIYIFVCQVFEGKKTQTNITHTREKLSSEEKQDASKNAILCRQRDLKEERGNVAMLYIRIFLIK